MKKMKLLKVFATALCMVTACMLSVPQARADEWNKKTKVTFSEPVEVPGVGAQILPAGTYVFKLYDSQSNRNIVQIFSEDEKQLFTTTIAINNYRLVPTDKTVMRFRERGEGQPEAIRAWFYPGDNFGQQFVYPRLRAAELAKISDEPVLATPIEFASAPVEALQSAPVEAVTPAGDFIELGQAIQPAPVVMASAKSLPQTSSLLPLIALAGLLSLGAGFAARTMAKRTA